MLQKTKKLSRLLLKRRNRLPEIIWLAVTNRCNLACRMCQRHYDDLIIEDMCPDNFRKMLPKIPAARTFVLGGCGEPLLNENFFEITSLITERFPAARIILTTNGTLLNGDIIGKILNSNISHVSISAEEVTEENTKRPGADMRLQDTMWHPADNRIIENVKELIRRRGRGRLPVVSIQSALFKDNAPGLFRLIKASGKLGIDSVRLLRLQAWAEPLRALRPDFRQERRLLEEARGIARAAGLKVDFAGEHSLPERIISRFDRFCLWTDDLIFLDVDGGVFPCCMLTGKKDMMMGNLLTGDLDEIWNGERFQHFFKEQSRHCSFCDTLKHGHAYK